MSFQQRSCQNCQVSFQAKISEIKRGNGKFCSRLCSSSQRKNRKVNVHLHNSTCSHCKTTYYMLPSRLAKKKSNSLRFCSRICMDKHVWRNKDAKVNNSSLRLLSCKQCNQLLPVTKSEFCNYDCRKIFDQTHWINQWLNEGLHRVSSRECIPLRIRNYLHEKHNSACEKCNWSQIHPVTKRVPLTVNHIDGNSANNDPSNLELICPNCHSLTPTYGSLNKGNGRSKRREQLQRGRLQSDLVDREEN